MCLKIGKKVEWWSNKKLVFSKSVNAKFEICGKKALRIVPTDMNGGTGRVKKTTLELLFNICRAKGLKLQMISNQNNSQVYNI